MKYLWLILTAAWFVFMTYLSHQPGSETVATSLHLAEMLGNIKLNGFLRKVAHVVTFLVLAVLISLCLKSWEIDWWFVLLVFLWCLVDEATKPIITGRHFEIADVLLNLAGTAVGIVVGLLLRSRAF